VVVGSLSKTYGLPGLRIGWSVAPDYVRAGVRRIRAYTSISPSVLSEDLAVRVLGVGRGLLDAQQAHSHPNLAHAEAFLNQTHNGLSWCHRARARWDSCATDHICHQADSPGSSPMSGEHWLSLALVLGKTIISASASARTRKR